MVAKIATLDGSRWSSEAEFLRKANLWNASVRRSPHGAVEGDREIAERFECLYKKWVQETAPLSSAMQIILHPAYQQIVGLGRPAIPLILEKLVQAPGHWSWALFAITGENPVASEDAGNMAKMRDAWLNLAREKGWLRGTWNS